MKHYLDKMVIELREEIDKDCIDRLENMFKCTVHNICNCDNVICKQELQERTDAWDVQNILEK